LTRRHAHALDLATDTRALTAGEAAHRLQVERREPVTQPLTVELAAVGAEAFGQITKSHAATIVAPVRILSE